MVDLNFDVDELLHNPLFIVGALIVIGIALVFVISRKARMAATWMFFFGHLPTAGEYYGFLVSGQTDTGKDFWTYATTRGKPFAFLNPAPIPPSA